MGALRAKCRSKTELPLTLQVSGLLFGIAPKSSQKSLAPSAVARFAPANRASLRFSPRPGGADSTSMYSCASAAIHRRAPAGSLRPRLRCSAPLTARFLHESVHPCTASRKTVASLRSCRSPLSFASICCSCFCGRMPPNRGPVRHGEQAEEMPEGACAGCARVRCVHTDVHSANPVACSRTRRAGCPEGAPSGVCFFGCFLCTSKESNPLGHRPSGSSALEDQQTKSEMGSGFRRNDEPMARRSQ